MSAIQTLKYFFQVWNSLYNDYTLRCWVVVCTRSDWNRTKNRIIFSSAVFRSSFQTGNVNFRPVFRSGLKTGKKFRPVFRFGLKTGKKFRPVFRSGVKTGKKFCPVIVWFWKPEKSFVRSLSGFENRIISILNLQKNCSNHYVCAVTPSWGDTDLQYDMYSTSWSSTSNIH